MNEITLVSRELTFFDMEFQESDISNNDKLQNIINDVIEELADEIASKNAFHVSKILDDSMSSKNRG